MKTISLTNKEFACLRRCVTGSIWHHTQKLNAETPEKNKRTKDAIRLRQKILFKIEEELL
jgi:hypothetical protein